MTDAKEKKTALVLAGGGTKGALQVGACRHIITDLQWEIRWIHGVSTGALQASVLSQGTAYGQAALEDVWLDLKKDSDLFIEPGWLGKAINFVFGKSLLSNKPLEELLRRRVSVPMIRESGIVCRVGVCNFNNKRYYQVSPDGLTDDTFFQFILASTSIPGEFPGRAIKCDRFPTGWYFDGGVMNVTPTIDGLIDAGAERIVVVLCNPLELPTDMKKYDGVLSSLTGALEITIQDNWVGDLERMRKDIEWYNRKILDHSPDAEGKHMVDFIVIAPTRETIGTLEVDPTKIRATMQIGYDTAKKAISAFVPTEVQVRADALFRSS